MIKELDANIDEMVALAARDDLEREHERADELLVETLRMLAVLLGVEISSKVEALLKAYDEVGKWYA